VARANEAEARGLGEVIVPTLLAAIAAYCVKTLARQISTDAIDA
jgi:hypothetical protein